MHKTFPYAVPVCVSHLLMCLSGGSSLEAACRLKRWKTETVSASQASSAARLPNTSLVTFNTHSFYFPMSNTLHPHSRMHTYEYSTHTDLGTDTYTRCTDGYSHTHIHTHTLSGSRPGRQAAGSGLDQINMRLVMRPQRRG